MKYLAYIHIIIIIGMMMACSEPHEYTEALSRAINIMKNNPDSAMRLLDSLGQHEQHFGRHFLMQYRLHRTNALNKLDTLFHSTNETQQFVNYFDTHGTPNEQMLAHYLLGRAYYDTGEFQWHSNVFKMQRQKPIPQLKTVTLYNSVGCMDRWENYLAKKEFRNIV